MPDVLECREDVKHQEFEEKVFVTKVQLGVKNKTGKERKVRKTLPQLMILN